MPTSDSPLANLPRIAARVRSPQQAQTARQIFQRLPGNEIHDDYQDMITGYVTPEIYKALLDAHLMVSSSELPPDQAKEMEPPAAALAFSEESPLDQRVKILKKLQEDAKQNPVPEGEAGLASDDQGDVPRMYEVTLSGPMRPQWAAMLRDLGITISSFVPPFEYRMLLTHDQVAKLSSLDWVRGKPQRYGLADSVTPEFLDEYNEALTANDSTPKLFDVTVHEPNQLGRVKMMLDSLNAKVVSEAGNSLRFEAPVTRRLAALADKDEVKLLAPFRPMSLKIDYGRTIVLGQPAPTGPPYTAGAPWPWDGKGETVAVIDSGVDDTHPGLTGPNGKSRVTSLSFKNLGTKDAIGHGTHVAGIIAARTSDGGLQGVAPSAEIISLRITDNSGVPQPDPDLTNMLEAVAQKGAKVINMSWAAKKMSARYDSYSQSVDAFVRKNPEVLVVIASGNEGTSRSDGYPAHRSAGTPATAKNAITVGACNTIRNGFTITYGQYRPLVFPNPPLKDLAMAGDSRYVAGFSSRGPTETNAVKPDLVAPGTFILSLRACGLPILECTGVLNPDSYDAGHYDSKLYWFCHGTSMAAPFVAGAAAVLRHYLREGLSVNQPSAALLKALLCASVTPGNPIVGPDFQSKVGYPDFDQGFGRLKLCCVIPVTKAGMRRVAFLDVANDSDRALFSRVKKGDPRRSSRRYSVKVNQGPLLIVVAWTDVAGNGIQNALHIDLENLDEGVQIVGNHLHKWPESKDRLPDEEEIDPAPIPYDRANNVQVISLDRAVAGTYRVYVTAVNTPFPDLGQGYAICARGNLASDITEV